MDVCRVCGKPDEPPYNHDITDDEAAQIDDQPCSAAGCGKMARVRCSLGAGGSGFFVCPKGHRFFHP